MATRNKASATSEWFERRDEIDARAVLLYLTEALRAGGATVGYSETFPPTGDEEPKKRLRAKFLLKGSVYEIVIDELANVF